MQTTRANLSQYDRDLADAAVIDFQAAAKVVAVVLVAACVVALAVLLLVA